MDAREFRNAMGQFATGVVVISAEIDGQPHAMTANAFMSGSLEPPLILVSVAHTARMHSRIEASERFAVSVLGENQQDISNHFAGRSDDGAAPAFERLDGLPVIANAVVQMAATLQHSYPCGDHTLFVGRVTRLHHCQPATLPLIFQGGRYQALASEVALEEAA